MMLHVYVRAVCVMLALWQLVSGSSSERCNNLRAIHKQLNYEDRVRYMKDNLPINYEIMVQKEEVYRSSNVTHMKQDKNISNHDLQMLWILINSAVLEKILMVLPEKHYSRNYTKDLSRAFDHLMVQFQIVLHDPEHQHTRNIIETIERNDPANWTKAVKPKALLDNCYKVMELLFNCTW